MEARPLAAMLGISLLRFLADGHGSLTVSLMCHVCSFSLTQHINELTMKLDVQQVLKGAEAIYLQLTRCQVGPGFLLV